MMKLAAQGDQSGMHQFLNGSTDYIAAIEDEFKLQFGDIGTFIVKKQVHDLKLESGMTVEHVQPLIDNLAKAVTNIIGFENSRDLRKRLRRRCGMAV